MREVSMTFNSLTGRACSTLLAAALFSGGASALSMTAVDGHAQAGQVGVVGFAVDFGAMTSVSSLSFDLGFNPFLIQPVAHGSSETFQGVPVDLDVALSAAGRYTAWITPTGLHTTWSATDGVTLLPKPPLELSGIGTISFSFHLDSHLTPGSAPPVSFNLSLYDANHNALPNLSAQAHLVVDALPVPEPASSALVLTGLLALAAVARRPTRRRSPWAAVSAQR
jgi:hypothetical protein